MKKLARILSYLSAGLSALTLFRSPRNFSAMAFWYPKLFAGSWAPVLAVLGGLGTVLGLLCRDLASVGAGLLGATVATRHTARVIAPHDRFEEAFGPDWQAHIPRALRARLPHSRYTLDLAPGPGGSCQRNLVYGTLPETGEPLRADVWVPPAGVPRTGLAVVYLFGGGWHYMHKDMWVTGQLRRMAGQGHVVVNADYTLAPKAQLPGMIADVKQAIAWVKAHGERYGVDRERIVLMGCSSGAHMALLAAYTPNHPAFQPPELGIDTSVRAVVSYSGFTDLRTSHDYLQTHFGSHLFRPILLEKGFLAGIGWAFRRLRLLPTDSRVVSAWEMVPSLLGGTPDEVPDRYRLGSPIEHVGPHCPPTLLLQGAHDFSGMRQDAHRLHRALRAAGVPSVYVEFPETEHGFEVLTMGAARWGPAVRAAAHDVDCFLALMV